MIEINLVPDVKLELLKARRQRKLVVSASILVAIVSVGVVALLAVYAFGAQTALEAIADNSIKDESGKLDDIKDLSKTLTIQHQLNELSSLQKDKKVSSRLFDIISVTVPSGENQVRISRLNMDTEANTIDIEAEAANGYEAMEVFKKTLAQTKFQFNLDGQAQKPINIAKTISEGERNYGEDADGKQILRFALSFTYPDELFDPSAQDGRVVAPNQQRATDSSQGVPESLFSTGGGQ